MSTYSDVVLATSGLVSYWRLGESNGTSAVDSKGSNTGTYINAPTLGVVGLLAYDPNTAVSFNRDSSNYVQVPDNASLEFSGSSFSLECWVLTSVFGGTILAKGAGSGATPSEYIWHVRGQGFNLNGNWYALDGMDNLGNCADAHHLVVVYDQAATTLYPYVDGLAQTPTTGATGYTTDLAHDLFIGRQGDTGTNYWTGVLGEVAIYNVALSAATIADHYTAGYWPQRVVMVAPQIPGSWGSGWGG